MDLFMADDAATPLTEEESQGLIPSWVTTRPELNAVEAQNIAQATQWAFGKSKRHWLSDKALRDLHRRMFGNVWSWAGRFRQTERNIGVSPYQIAPELRVLLEDTLFWITHDTWPTEEIAVRFHHRLVAIHPFPNGNGRHARLATDLLLVHHLAQPVFSWGQRNNKPPETTRLQYIEALRAADAKQYDALLTFVRS